MKRARFVAPAREEFLADVAWYDQVQPGQGVRFSAAVEEATARALAFPLAGSTATPTIRRVIIKNFPFSLVDFRRMTQEKDARQSQALGCPALTPASRGRFHVRRPSKTRKDTCQCDVSCSPTGRGMDFLFTPKRRLRSQALSDVKR